IPGVDAVFKQIEPDKFNDTSRLAGSVKRIKDLPFALSESLAVMGHSVHPDFIRFVSDYQIVRGINKFLYKLSNYNPQKARYFHPPELGCTNPLIKNYGKKLFKRVSQICCIASGGSSGPKVCLYIPCNNYCMGEGNEIAKIIEDLARKLAYNQIEFDYVWEGSFNSYYIRDKKIVLGDEIYHCLIIPEKSKPSDSEMLLIKHLAEQGTAIISPEIFRLPGPNIRYSSCLDEIIDLLQEQIKAYSLSIKPKNLSISVLTRIYDSYQFYMLLNESAKSFNCKVKLRYQGNVYLMEQNSECLLPMGGNNIPLNFKPSETKILVLDTGSSKKIESARLKHRIKPKNWKLKLPSGEIVSIKEPFPLWNNLGYEGYSGFMDYYAEFICDKHINPAILELGTVYYCATCFIDNKKAGDAIFTPYRIILKNLSRGKHSLKIRVFNTPANEICGDKTRFRRLQQKGVFNGTYAPIYLSIDRKKIASGLLGKVRIYSIF
ncbi:MAG TPA: hypothetical protein PKX05_02665, partial [bacterium]|nr:hypothetical protein [bacterium]